MAKVAMPREYTENDSRQMKLPDAWRWWRPACPGDRSLIFPPKQKLTQASSLATCEAGTAGRAALSPCPPPHHACTPTASPSGVLKHRDDPFAVLPTLVPPVPSQVLSHVPHVCSLIVRMQGCRAISAVLSTWCKILPPPGRQERAHWRC